MRTAAIIVAAGRGERLGGPLPKQYRRIGGEMVLTRTLRAALAAPGIDAVIAAIAPDAEPLYAEAAAPLDDPRLLLPVPGGAHRAESVRRALEALERDPPEVVLVHDAARPFASPVLFAAVAEAVCDGTGAIAADPVADALWRESDGKADASVLRAGLWHAQTPQGFPYAALLAAHRAGVPAGAPPPLDDAEVFRRAGHAVRLVPGETENFKITTAGDLARAERMLELAMTETRIGQGFDVHRFAPGEHITLGGVRIPHERSLEGHSDADVALHALADALYGAIGEGDIGTHFPPSDPQWRGAASHVFLSHAAGRVAARGGRVVNIDLTLLCERPKIAPHAAAMRGRIGQILGLDPGRVSIKATTMERLGFIGREEGMAAIATATVTLPRGEGV